jgi:hypothetical protein
MTLPLYQGAGSGVIIVDSVPAASNAHPGVGGAASLERGAHGGSRGMAPCTADSRARGSCRLLQSRAWGEE